MQTEHKAAKARRYVLEVDEKILQAELGRMVDELKRDETVSKVIVFGSVATGEIHEWSDIDLVVVQETSLPFLERIRVLLQRLEPRVGVDLLVYTPEEFERLCRERSFFRDEILSKGKTLYEKRS